MKSQAHICFQPAKPIQQADNKPQPQVQPQQVQVQQQKPPPQQSPVQQPNKPPQQQKEVPSPQVPQLQQPKPAQTTPQKAESQDKVDKAAPAAEQKPLNQGNQIQHNQQQKVPTYSLLILLFDSLHILY